MKTTADQTAEERIRLFLTGELMHEWAAEIGLSDVFELDSLDQVDLRMFLEENFSIKFTENQKPFTTLQTILDCIHSQECTQ